MRHIIIVVPHAGWYGYFDEAGMMQFVYLQRGKQSPDGRIMEGVWLRQMVSRIGDDVQMHVLEPGDIESPPGKRAKAINILASKFGYRNCLAIEPHINAGGNGRKWVEAQGHRVIHNGRYGAKDAAKSLNRILLYESPVTTKSRGVAHWARTGRILTAPKNVKCAMVMPELFFMDSIKECNLGWDKQQAFASLLRGFGEAWIG